MPIPNLIHPVPIIIQSLDASNTFQDDDYAEPVQQAVHEAAVTVVGQVDWETEKAAQVGRGGIREDSIGYVLFRYVDLAIVGLTLKINDRILKVGLIETDLYINRLLPLGHYPDMGGATMVKAFFIDRQPKHQRLDV